MPKKIYTTKEELLIRAKEILYKSIRPFIPKEEVFEIEERIKKYN
jgi:hypothetical protein